MALWAHTKETYVVVLTWQRQSKAHGLELKEAGDCRRPPTPSHLLHTDSNPIEHTGTMNAPCSKDAWAVSSQPSPLPFGDSQGCGE